MASRIVIDGNAFYEIDEDCTRYQKERQKRESESRELGRQTQKGQETGEEARRSQRTFRSLDPSKR